MKTLFNQSLTDKKITYINNNGENDHKLSVTQVSKPLQLSALSRLFSDRMLRIFIKIRNALFLTLIIGVTGVFFTFLLIRALDIEEAAKVQVMMDYEDHLKKSVPFEIQDKE